MRMDEIHNEDKFYNELKTLNLNLEKLIKLQHALVASEYIKQFDKEWEAICNNNIHERIDNALQKNPKDEWALNKQKEIEIKEKVVNKALNILTNSV